jgi:acetyltransferase-like isoleucine patch superfamily enzyme
VQVSVRRATVWFVNRRARNVLQRSFARVDRAQRRYLEIRTGDPLAQRFAAFGTKSRLGYPHLELWGAGSIAIGDRTVIRSYWSMEALAPEGTVVLRFGNDIHVGHYVRFVAVNGIDVEDNAAIGHGSTITDTIHTWKDAEENAGYWQQPLKVGRPLRLARGSWIGNSCVVNGGITVGEGAVVVPGSVINRDVPAGTMVGGNPARVLKHRTGKGWEWLVDPASVELEIPEALRGSAKEIIEEPRA